ncbi:MAG: hypothetical protein J7K75_02995 [Desulfuromonas sp.]|nr:hypothetical protein [Desulfuromonas sp.]
MRELKKHFDLGSLVIIATTFVLFVSAVFTKGFTHDLLLEAAVFLVSVKLIIMAYKSVDATESLHKKLDEIYEKINEIEVPQSRSDNDSN